MITEVVRLSVKPGTEPEFELAIEEGEKIFKAAKGCRGMSLKRSIENKGQYNLFVTWEKIEDHLVDFKSSEGLVAWRQLVGHYLASPPAIEHFQVGVKGFAEEM